MPEVATVGVQRTVLADGKVKIAGAGYVGLITHLKPGCLLVAERGTQTRETRAALINEVEAEMAAQSPITIFIDTRATSRMDSVGRDEWSAFGKRHRADLQRVVVLVTSKLLEMAFSVMGMFLGGGMIRVLSSERDMIREIQREVPTFRDLPTISS
jgi:hypothetical protein